MGPLSRPLIRSGQWSQTTTVIPQLAARINVAELAKSFDRLGNSPKAYAASATSFHLFPRERQPQLQQVACHISRKMSICILKASLEKV